MLRILYMGTPHFAVPALEALVHGSAPGEVLPQGYEIAAVISRPDKPSGRSQEIVYSPVKQTALAHGLPVWQPGSFKKPENQARLAAYQADLFIVAAFGQILPQAVLDLPGSGTLNIHASLLPKYRGSSPITAAILQGERETGITIMLIDAGIDTGPILSQSSLALAENETTASLAPRLAELGATTLLETLPGWIGKRITPQPQDPHHASHTHMLTKEDGRINWSQPAEVLERQVRAYNPWPNAYTTWRGKRLKLLAAHPLPASPIVPERPGTVFLETLQRAGKAQKTLRIVTGQGSLEVEQVQLEGKKVMTADEFLRGYAQISGEVLA